jgi:hypothetical protein
MATKRVDLKTSMKLLSPSIIAILVLKIISVNSMVAIAQSDIPHEIDYYENLSGVYIESTFPWSQFQNLDGYFLRVSRQGLRQESLKVLNAIGVSRVFVDTSRGVIWITGIASVHTTEARMFVYYWISPSGGIPAVYDDRLPVGVV